MANYSMYFDCLTDVAKWKEYEESKKIAKRSTVKETTLDSNIKECIPIKFTKDEKDLDKFTLEELDCLTSQFKDQEAFFKALNQRKAYNNLFTNGTNKNFIIVYKHKGEYRKHDVIYNNSLLATSALEVRKEKELGKKDGEIVLTETRELDAFISQIKKYALSNTENFMKSRLVSYKLKETLEDYIDFKQRDMYLTNEEYAYLNELEGKISKYIRNYKTLRKLIVWQQKNILNNKKTSNDEYVQQTLDIPESNHNESPNYSENEINSMMDEEESDLMMWYKLGLKENNGDKSAALDMVFRNVEDIYSYNEEELEKIGITKGKNR